MNILDLLILGLIVFLVIKGSFRGFFREICSLAGIVLGLLIGNRYHPQMACVISFFALFIVVFILFSLYGALLHNMFKTLLIGWLDRGLGVCLGLIKGIVIAYLLIVLLTVFVPSTTPLIARSRLAPLVKVSFESMRRLISPDLYRIWMKRISRGSQEIGRAVHQGKGAMKAIPQVLPDKKE